MHIRRLSTKILKEMPPSVPLGSVTAKEDASIPSALTTPQNSTQSTPHHSRSQSSKSKADSLASDDVERKMMHYKIPVSDLNQKLFSGTVGMNSQHEASTDVSTAASRASIANSIKRLVSSETELSKHNKKTRRSSHQKQDMDAITARRKANESKALKQVTLTVAENWKKYAQGNNRRTTIAAECRRVNAEMKSNVSAVTAARYIREGRVDESPVKHGPPGKFVACLCVALKGAYTTFMRLKQVEAKEQMTVKHMAKRLVSCVRPAGYKIDGRHFARRFDAETAHLFMIDQKNNMEKRRVEWTTYHNLSVWFDLWKEFLIEKGFGRATRIDDIDDDSVDGTSRSKGKGEIVFFDGQLSRIINIDETDLSLDCTDGKGGGRPAAVRGDPLLPQGADKKNKSSDRCTMLTGSTAAGEAIPPYAHFKSSAKSQNQRIDVSGWRFICNVEGQFGHDRRKRFLPTVGMNEKGGMNSEALFAYFQANIIPLYPDSNDTPGKRVLIKIDSGPGRMNEEMLAYMRARGFYLYPGVPNTTQVTQKTDQNYGEFKRVWRKNLDVLCAYRFDKRLAAQPGARQTVNMSDVWLLLFGGKENDLDEACPQLDNAFEKAFNYKMNQWAWAKVGACPLTRACLAERGVRHEIVIESDGSINVDANPMTSMLLSLECTNKLFCDLLSSHGCDSSQFRIDAPRTRKITPASTSRLSVEYQDKLAAVSTAGAHFKLGGGTLSANEFFLGKERQRRKEKINELKAKKLSKEEFDALAIAGHALMEQHSVAENGVEHLCIPDLKELLKWKLYGTGITMKGAMRKSDLVNLWKTHPLPSPPTTWDDSNEAELKALEEENIELSATALGRQYTTSANSIIGGLSTGASPLNLVADIEKAIDDAKHRSSNNV